MVVVFSDGVRRREGHKLPVERGFGYDAICVPMIVTLGDITLKTISIRQTRHYCSGGRLSQVHMFVIPAGHFSVNANESGYLRLIYQGNVFYTNKACYKHPETLNVLSKEGNWYLAVLKMASGHYWIHWIADNHHLIAEPDYASINIRNIIFRGVISVALALLSAVVFFIFDGVSLIVRFIPLAIFFGAVMIFIFSVLSDLSLCLNTNCRKILHYLARARQHDFSFFSPPEQKEGGLVNRKKQTVMNTPLKAKDEEVGEVEGSVADVNLFRWSVPKGGADDLDQNYSAVGFFCGQQVLFMCWKSVGHSPFLVSPPPFLAVGDRIFCQYETKFSKKIYSFLLPDRVNRVIRLVNLTDGSVYSSNGDACIGWNRKAVERVFL